MVVKRGIKKKILQYIIAGLVIFIQPSNSINLGLFAGHYKRHLNPLIIKKYSHHSPIFINIKPGLLAPRVARLTPPLLKIPHKPVKLAPSLPLLPKLRLPIITRPILPRIPPPILLPPLVPKIPLLALVPRLPLLIPRLKGPLSPLKVPIVRKCPLQLALGSEIKPTRVLPPRNVLLPRNPRNIILDKLLQLRRTGSLTIPEYFKFRKLLL